VTAKLTVADIVDQRAYERERSEYRRRIILLKQRRRVGVGPIISVLFENRDTVRFQIQEMARAERLITDAAIQGELDTYNPLIPEPGQLSATLFVELTSEVALRDWLPRLVGLERTVALTAGEGPTALRVAAEPFADHVAALSRDDTTASVHYLRWTCTPAQVTALTAGPVRLVVDHPEYRHAVPLPAATRIEVLGDLLGR